MDGRSVLGATLRDDSTTSKQNHKDCNFITSISACTLLVENGGAFLCNGAVMLPGGCGAAAVREWGCGGKVWVRRKTDLNRSSHSRSRCCMTRAAESQQGSCCHYKFCEVLLIQPNSPLEAVAFSWLIGEVPRVGNCSPSTTLCLKTEL